MASAAPNKSVVARAAAILTTGEVAAATLDLNETHDYQVSVQLDFTKGSLTSAAVKHYVSADGATWYPLYDAAGNAATESLSADGTRCYVFPSLAGWKSFRTTIQGSGTVTSSSATIVYRYGRRGSQ